MRRSIALGIVIGDVLALLSAASCSVRAPTAMRVHASSPHEPLDPAAGFSSTQPWVTVSDFNQSGAVDGGDIQHAIDSSCGSGFLGGFRGSCMIVLPAGVISIPSTLTIGTPEPVGMTNGLSIRGQGMSIGMSGTLLAWTGPEGGTMLRIYAGRGISLEDFTLYMDPKPHGAPAAKIAIELSGDNSISRIISGVRLQAIEIGGSPYITSMPGSRGIYFRTPGGGASAQMELTAVEQCAISGVEVGIENDESQAVYNSVSDSIVTGRLNAFRVSQGNVDVHRSIIGCYDQGCVVYWLEKRINQSPFKTTIAGNHWETGEVEGTFVKVGHGYSATSSHEGPIWPLTVRDNSIQHQCASPCVTKFIDAAMGAVLTVTGNALRGPPGAFSVQISAFAPIKDFVQQVIWSGNQLSTIPGGIGLVALTPQVSLEAWRRDHLSGALFNDLNLNARLDPTEPSAIMLNRADPEAR